MKPFLLPALLIALTLIVALLSLAVTPGDASRALPVSTAPFVQALRAEAPIDPLPVRSAAPTCRAGLAQNVEHPCNGEAAGSSPAPGPIVGSDEPSASPVPSARPTSMPRHTRFLRGQATWWDSWGHGFYVAVNPSDGIRVGTMVTVCGGTPFGCLAAPATTTCACLGRDSGRIVDLSRDLFARFADPSRGVTEVVLEW